MDPVPAVVARSHLRDCGLMGLVFAVAATSATGAAGRVSQLRRGLLRRVGIPCAARHGRGARPIAAQRRAGTRGAANHLGTAGSGQSCADDCRAYERKVGSRCAFAQHRRYGPSDAHDSNCGDGCFAFGYEAAGAARICRRARARGQFGDVETRNAGSATGGCRACTRNGGCSFAEIDRYQYRTCAGRRARAPVAGRRAKSIVEYADGKFRRRGSAATAFSAGFGSFTRWTTDCAQPASCCSQRTSRCSGRQPARNVCGNSAR